jgi:hypothetical protein
MAFSVARCNPRLVAVVTTLKRTICTRQVHKLHLWHRLQIGIVPGAQIAMTRLCIP